jgi:drug/metabolite transporter (DMT)-like permease
MWTGAAMSKLGTLAPRLKGPPMETPRTGLGPVFALGVVLVVVGVLTLVNSTDFDPDPLLGDLTNSTGQVAGVVVAASGAVVLAIVGAASAICRRLLPVQQHVV